MRTTFALAVWVVSLAACATDPDPTSSTGQGVTAYNKLSSNKLSSNKLSSNKLSSNKLSSNKLSSNKLSSNMLSSADLLSTPDGREVYGYIVSCALPANLTLEATIEGVTYDFPGGIGLTPYWLNEPLDDQGKGWISACLFARCNAYDTAEEISLRGPNKALDISATELSLYTLEEAAFYGNVFTPDDQPIDWNACRGEDKAAGDAGGLFLRDCAKPDPANPGYTMCGFKYAGDCADYTPQYPSPYACADFNAPKGGWYDDCHSTSGLGRWPHTTRYEQVITTYVTP